MPRTNHQLQRFKKQQLIVQTAHQLRIGHSSDADIDFSRFQARQQHGVIHGRDLQGDILLLLVKLANHRGQNPQRSGWQRSDTHDVVAEAFFTIQRLPGGIERVQHFHRMGKKLFPDQRELSAKASALKQPRTGKLLKFIQGFGQSRLAKV